MVPRVHHPPLEPHLRPPLEHRALSTSTKRSYRSYSSSVEADDERSSSADHENMGPDLAAAFRDRPSQYPGEDTRLTSRKELAGWYAYGFAAEVFAICGIGSFIPITLEQLARENGVLLPDRTTPCGSSSARPGPLGVLPDTLFINRKDLDQCVVYVLGLEINTASFAMYTFSLSVLLQALIVVSISCAADHGDYRKSLLLLFAVGGSISTMLFLPVPPNLYLLAAFLAMIANTCFGASFVLLNSFLPLLVRHHPKAQYGGPEFSSAISSSGIPAGTPEVESDEETLLIQPSLPPSPSPEEKEETRATIELQLSTQISSSGIGIGYSAGLFLQCVCIIVILALKSTTLSLRLVLFIIGAWWFVFTIPAALWLRPRPGPPLSSNNPNNPKATRSWFNYIAYSWASLWRTVKLAGRLRDVTLFHLAWFLLSDAIATVSGTAVLYAKTELHMKPAALGLINVIATTCGVFGAFSWSKLSRVLGFKPHQTILACICLFEIIPLYGLLGYIPFIRNWGVLGLQQPWEMYPLGALYGFILGGLSSYCRSLFGSLVPPGSEAAFYALYAITDKGSSVFGPAIVGAIVDATGEIRPAFWFLALLIGIPAIPIAFVNTERGRTEGAKLAEVIEGFRVAEASRANSGAASLRGEADVDDLSTITDEDERLLS